MKGRPGLILSIRFWAEQEHLRRPYGPSALQAKCIRIMKNNGMHDIIGKDRGPEKNMVGRDEASRKR
jgi:hypothetical protein